MPQYSKKLSSTLHAPLSQSDEDKIPLFLIKLWNILDDTAYSRVISWDETGYSFHVHDPYSFCKIVLPQYFKHNNLNSFVRQLNMYGFRKITPLERSGLTRAESDHEHLEFTHPRFIRNRPELLSSIKRKVSVLPRNEPVDTPASMTFSWKKDDVSDQVRKLRDRQSTMETKMTRMTKENNSLWQEVSHLRTMHMKQEQVINKLIQFLVGIVQPAQKHRLSKRNFLAIKPDEQTRNAKRGRSDYTNGNLLFPDGSLSPKLLNRLKRELDLGDQTPLNGGPIIAEVTDDQQQTADSFQPNHLPIIGANVTLTSGSNSPIHPGETANPMLDMGHQFFNASSFRRQPSNQSPAKQPTVLQLNSPLDMPLSQELSEFLTNVDPAGDNFRDLDLLSNGSGLQIDPDKMRELFDLCELAPLEDDNNQQSCPYTSPNRIQGDELALYQKPQFVFPTGSTATPEPFNMNIPSEFEDLNYDLDFDVDPKIDEHLLTPIFSPDANFPVDFTCESLRNSKPERTAKPK